MRNFSPALQRLTKVTENAKLRYRNHQYPRASVFTEGRVRSFCVAIAGNHNVRLGFPLIGLSHELTLTFALGFID
jgi:hypothetical protein